jgi:hypothetical protein
LGFSSEEEDQCERMSGLNKEMLQKMLIGNGGIIKEMPGSTPMNTQMGEENM